MRPARTFDALRIVALLEEAHASSRFADAVGVDRDYARKLIAGLVQRHGGAHDGASLVNVIEVDGQIEAFMLGILGRVYHIGDKLVADDMFLVATDKAPKTATNRLIGAYLDWAEANPRVHEIRLSWSDALDTGPRMASIYERKGFTLCGSVYRRACVHEAERIAA